MSTRKQPLISVLLPFYRESEIFFTTSVESILGQSFPDFEVILICDDPSNQNLINAARRFEKIDSRVKVEINNHNYGLTRSLNKGIQLARGSYICRMDADDVSSKTRFEDQLNIMDKEGFDLVGGNVEVIDESGETLYSTDNPFCSSETMAKALRWNNCIPHPTWMGKRSVFATGYRNIPLCEDYDFLLRSALAGKKLGLCPNIVLKYRMTNSSISRNSMYKQYLSQRFLTKKYKNKHDFDIPELLAFIDCHDNAQRSNNYIKANSLFNKALESLANRRVVKGLGGLVRCSTLSLGYIDKIRRLGLASATLKLGK